MLDFDTMVWSGLQKCKNSGRMRNSKTTKNVDIAKSERQRQVYILIKAGNDTVYQLANCYLWKD